MGRLLLVFRLVIGDIKRRRVQSVLLLVMIVTTTTTLTLGLAIRGAADSPWARTRAATKGPDVVAIFSPGPGYNAGTFTQFSALRRARGVIDSSGPYPLAFPAQLAWGGIRVLVQAEGRDHAPVAVDQPLITAGSWVRRGGVVIEQALADALGVHVGNTIRLNARPFQVTGIALTTSQAFYPESTPGLVWLTRADTTPLAAKSQPLNYVLNLKLINPAAAATFANSYPSDTAWFLQPWQQVRESDGKVIAIEQQVLLIVSWLLAMLAIASIAVLVGGRMAEQTRRVGLLKAVGGTPRLVAVVLLAENLLLALTAAVVGLAAGELLAPLLTRAGNGLLGSPGSPSLTVISVVLVACLAAAVATAATIVPAIRGARTSTIRALNDPAHPPRRRPRLIAISARLPVPLLLGIRLVARRPRRSILAAASLLIAVAMIVAALTLQHQIDARGAQAVSTGILPGELARRPRQPPRLHPQRDPRHPRRHQHNRHHLDDRDRRPTSHRTRPRPRRDTRQISAGLATAQLLRLWPASASASRRGLGSTSWPAGTPLRRPAENLWLLADIPATLLVVAGLTAIPAHIGAHRSIAQTLAAE